MREEFGDELKFVLDGGDCKVGLESTIVSCLGDGPRVLRPGSISLSQLRAVVPTIQVGPESDRAARAGHDDASLLAGDAGQRRAEPPPRAGDERVHRQPREGRGAGAAPAGQGESVHDLDQRRHAPGPVRAAAVREPAHARQGGREVILVEEVPPGEKWDAVRDRLKRAASAENIVTYDQDIAAWVADFGEEGGPA